MKHMMRHRSFPRFHSPPASLFNCVLLLTSVAVLLLAQHVLLDWLTLD